MGVLGAEAGEDDAFFVGLAIAVGVGEVQQLSTLGDIRAAVAGLDAGGDKEAVGEHGCFVRDAIAGGILEHDNFIIGGLAGFYLRINRRGGHPQAALGIKIHLDGLCEAGIFGKELNLDAGHGGEFGEFLRGEWCGFNCLFLWHNFLYRLEVAQRGDFLFLGGDERVELRNLDGIVALLVFSKAEDVRHVLRTRTVEEEFVFAVDDFAECSGWSGFETRVLRNAELRADAIGNGAVACVMGVNAVLR